MNTLFLIVFLVGYAAANAISEAITEAIRGGAPRDAVAKAVADATALELDEVNGYLDAQDTQAIADAIATSTGGTAYAESISVAEVRKKNSLRSVVTEFAFCAF